MSEPPQSTDDVLDSSEPECNYGWPSDDVFQCLLEILNHKAELLGSRVTDKHLLTSGTSDLV